MEPFDILTFKQQGAVLKALQDIAAGRATAYPSGHIHRQSHNGPTAQQMARQALHENGLTWPRAEP